MREFRKLPEEIQKQIFIRLLSGVACLLLFVIAWTVTGKFFVSVTLLILSGAILVNGGYMLYNTVKGKYLCIEGECVEIERTKLIGRAKRIYMEAEGQLICIPMHRNLSRLRIGDAVIIYLSAQTPLIPHRDGYAINNFYAVKAERKKDE